MNPFLMYLYFNNSVNIMYSGTNHYLKAKLFALVLYMCRKTCNSNYVRNKIFSDI